MGYEWFMNGILMGYNTGIFLGYDIWLVVYHPLKNHGVKVSWDYDMTPTEWNFSKNVFQTTNKI